MFRFVDGKETDGLLVGQHVITHNALFLSSGEGIVEECLDIFLLKLLDRHQHLGGVQQHVGTVDGSIDQEVALEGLAQILLHIEVISSTPLVVIDLRLVVRCDRDRRRRPVCKHSGVVGG